MNERDTLTEFANDIFKCGIALDGTDFAFGVDGDSHFDRLAKALDGIGYRKIHDGAVVISKEEYAELCELRNQDISLFVLKQAHKLELSKVRKETAKEIFCKLLNICYYENNPRYSLAAVEIRYIAKIEYGVEVEENGSV